MDNDPRDVSDDVAKDDAKKTQDLGGRRKKADRRGRTTVGVFPERRWQRHRRDGGDRRSCPFFSPRQHRERRDTFKETDQEENC